MPKDLFSTQSSVYAKYRPNYPAELINYILRFVKEKNSAWDCATGNGQAAKLFAGHFNTIEATDISEAQLKNAVQKETIHYSISTAEQTPFADNSFDLITVATAYHWFNWKEFYTEATRVGKPGCVVAAWAYNLLASNEAAINNAILFCYRSIAGPYWDKERRHVEEAYGTVDFNFAPLPSKDFTIAVNWTKEELLGYFATWSAVQHYQKQKDASPLPLMKEVIEKVWPGNERKDFYFPLFLKIGRVIK